MAGPAAPLLYGLYLLAGVAGKEGAKYVVKKYGPNAVGNLLSRHGTRDLAAKAKNKFLNLLSESKDTGPPTKFKNLPRSARNKFQDESGKPYNITIPKTPGVTKSDAIVGRPRVRQYTLKRRGEGFVAGTAVGAAVGKGVDYLLDKIKKAKKEDTPTGLLKKQFMDAVKEKTTNPTKIAQARTDFDSFVAGKKRSLNFNYGGMVKKAKTKRSK